MHSQFSFLTRGTNWVGIVSSDFTSLVENGNNCPKLIDTICTFCYNFAVSLRNENQIDEALLMLDMMLLYYKKGSAESSNVPDLYRRLTFRAQLYFRNRCYDKSKTAVMEIFDIIPLNMIELESVLHIYVASSIEINTTCYQSAFTRDGSGAESRWAVHLAELKCLENCSTTPALMEAKLEFLLDLQSLKPESAIAGMLVLKIGRTYRDLGRISEARNMFESLTSTAEPREVIQFHLGRTSGMANAYFASLSRDRINCS